MMRVLAFVFVCMAVLFHVPLAHAGKSSAGWAARVVPSQTIRIEPVAELFLCLATREGITEPEDRRAMIPAAVEGGRAFWRHLNTPPKKRIQLTREVDSHLQRFRADYASAGEGLDGAERRGLAMDALVTGVVGGVDPGGIPHSRFDMAFLAGMAAFERKLEERPASRSLSDSERELVDLLLLEGTTQFQRRSSMNALSATMNLGFGATYREVMDKQFQWADIALKNESISLERDLAEGRILADGERLRAMQLNLEAITDIFMFRWTLELFYGAAAYDLTSMAARMDSAGGAMSGMNVDRLVESGLVHGGAAERPYLPFAEFAFYDWVRPEMSLRYDPLHGLTSKVGELGLEVPTPPDFFFFDDPYRAVIELAYDFKLLNTLYWGERRQAEEEMGVTMQPLSLRKRFELRRDDDRRRREALERFRGAGRKEVHAIGTLLSGFLK